MSTRSSRLSDGPRTAHGPLEAHGPHTCAGRWEPRSHTSPGHVHQPSPNSKGARFQGLLSPSQRAETTLGREGKSCPLMQWDNRVFRTTESTAGRLSRATGAGPRVYVALSPHSLTVKPPVRSHLRIFDPEGERYRLVTTGRSKDSRATVYRVAAVARAIFHICRSLPLSEAKTLLREALVSARGRWALQHCLLIGHEDLAGLSCRTAHACWMCRGLGRLSET